MRRAVLQLVHIADGFADDCDELIHRCSKMDTLTYSTFCEIWKDMNFASLYKYRTTGSEIAEVSEEVIHIAKRYMFANTSNFEESVAGLFLIYGLLNLQPYHRFAALRVIPDDVAAIRRIELVARRDRRYDVLFILGSVLIRGPCQFHAVERERGMELGLRKYVEGIRGIDHMGVRPKGVFYRQNEELDLIRELNHVSRKYNEAKLPFTEGNADRNLSYTQKNLSLELEKSLKKILNGLIDDDDDADAVQMQHYESVTAIKAKAMKLAVNTIKHRSGVQDKQGEIQGPKILAKKKPSPTKAGSQIETILEDCTRKRKANSPKKLSETNKRNMKSISSDSSNSDEEIILLSDVETTAKDANKEMDLEKLLSKPLHNDESDEDDNLASIRNKSDHQIDTLAVESGESNEEILNEQLIDIEIDSLPVIIKAQNDNQIEIEIIDHFKKDNIKKSQKTKEQTFKSKLVDLPEVSLQLVKYFKSGESSKGGENEEMAKIRKLSNDDDGVFKKPADVDMSIPKLKRPDKRELKKTIMKSKFKRLGMLPIANFKDDSDK